MFYLTLAIVAIPVAVYYYCTRTFDYWKKRNVKHPKPVPLFGNIMDTALNRKQYFEVLKEIYDQYPDEKIVGVYRMTTPCLLIRDLDLINQIMIQDFDKFSDRGMAFRKDELGINLIHATGDTWKVLRAKFTPMFTAAKLKHTIPLMTQVGDKIVDYISNETQSQSELQTSSIVQRYFMAVLSACVFGLDIDIISKEQMKQLQKIDEIVFIKTIFIEIDMMFPGILQKCNISLFPKKLTKFFKDIVELGFAARNGTPSNRQDFMDMFIEMRNEGKIESRKRDENNKVLHLEVSESLVAAQAFAFYVAGYETTSAAMSCMLYLLAKHQDVQDKVREEINQVLQKYKGEVTYEALMEMTYLDKVFSETLRMYSPTDYILRLANEDYTIPGSDVVIAKGQSVLVSAHGIHYDEKYYPNPEKFDPERFSAENSRERHPCASMAFGVGPRYCIGSRFGKLTSGVCAVKLLSKFKVKPSPSTPDKIKYDSRRILLYPQGGIPLNFVPVDYLNNDFV